MYSIGCYSYVLVTKESGTWQEFVIEKSGYAHANKSLPYAYHIRSFAYKAIMEMPQEECLQKNYITLAAF